MMLVPASIVLLLSFQFAAVLSAESCACEAEHLGFAIDCTDTATMLTAFNALQTSSCATDCSSEDCTLNYYIIQAHHDYCQDGEVPTEIEDGFHDFDTVCVACEIQRSATEGAPDCPTSVCDDGSGDAAYSAMLDAGCLTDCSPEACGTNFLTLVAVHDNCPHESLTTAAEEGLHDMESICTMHACNSATTAESQVVCDDHAHEGGNNDHIGVKELTVNLATGFLVLIPFIALL